MLQRDLSVKVVGREQARGAIGVAWDVSVRREQLGDETCVRLRYQAESFFESPYLSKRVGG